MEPASSGSESSSVRETVRRDLAGRVILVTGAGRGLGRALARIFTECNARVAACARTVADLESLSGELGDADHLVAPVDVTDATQLERFVRAAVDRWGRIDGLVNAAAVLDPRRPLSDVSLDSWRRVLDVNLTGVFLACRAALPHMRARGGSIVNVSSGVGDRPRTRWGAYAVSKWALEGFSWNLAEEQRDQGVRVNVVDPGRMRTGMRRSAYPDEDPDTLPDPAEVAPVFLWLMDAESAGVTGQRFVAQDWTPPRER